MSLLVLLVCLAFAAASPPQVGPNVNRSGIVVHIISKVVASSIKDDPFIGNPLIYCSMEKLKGWKDFELDAITDPLWDICKQCDSEMGNTRYVLKGCVSKCFTSEYFQRCSEVLNKSKKEKWELVKKIKLLGPALDDGFTYKSSEYPDHLWTGEEDLDESRDE